MVAPVRPVTGPACGSPHPFPAVVAAACRSLGVTQPVVVACSGGGDSLALLRACLETAGGPITAAYFDHRQRANSAADGRHVAALAAAWGCRFAAGGFTGGPGASEAAMRHARYGWLNHVAAAAGATWVLTGHTADDRAETVLMRIVRGTGVAGLAGIPAVGPVPGRASGDVRVARPLLGLTGRDARAFLADRGVRWVEDPTNATPDRTRTRLRHEVLPALEELNPKVRAALLRLADGAGGTAAATAALADAALAPALHRCDERRLELRDAALPPPGSAARAEVWRAAWRRAGWPRQKMTAAAWNRLAALTAGASPTELPHRVRATVGGGLVRLHRAAAPAGPAGPGGR